MGISMALLLLLFCFSDVALRAPFFTAMCLLSLEVNDTILLGRHIAARGRKPECSLGASLEPNFYLNTF